MNSRLLHISIASLLLLLAACSGGRNPSGRSAGVKSSNRIFVPVLVPSAISEPQAAVEYLREHYWDNLDFADSLFFAEADTAMMLGAFADYVSLLEPVGDTHLGQLMHKASASGTAFRYFAMLADEVLYDPNSPLRNDELYIPVLEAQLAAPLLDKYEKLVPADRLHIALQNRLGQTANDFYYVTADGRSSTLYALKADRILLFFSNPGCPMCKSIAEYISFSPVFGRLTDSDRLKILTVYPDDDLQAWRSALPGLPSSWINSVDDGEAITARRLYDLKAIPSLYLLDADKRVIIKDSSDIQFIESVLVSEFGEVLKNY